MWTIEKVSTPTWKREFDSKEAAIKELAKHICNECLEGKQGYVDSSVEGGIAYEVVTPPNPNSEHDLLSTPCGCEFELRQE